MVENYLKSTGNPNLKLGDIKDEGQNSEADVVTKDNSLADKILVDKNTGWMRLAYLSPVLTCSFRRAGPLNGCLPHCDIAKRVD